MDFGVKFSVILTLDPFRVFLLEKILFLTLFQYNIKFHYNWSRFILNSLLFSQFYAFDLDLRVRSLCLFLLISFLSLNGRSLHHQFQLSNEPRDSFGKSTAHAYLLFFLRFSTFLLIYDTFLFKLLIAYSLSFLSFLYSSNLVFVKLTVSFKPFSCSPPLIWLSLELEVIWND